MLGMFFRWLTGGALDRILDTVDRKVQAESDRERIKADLIAAHYRHRVDWMGAGGLVLMLLFAVPLSIWFTAVLMDCIPYVRDIFGDEQVHALPPPLDEWAGGIIISIFGVIGVTRFKEK